MILSQGLKLPEPRIYALKLPINKTTTVNVNSYLGKKSSQKRKVKCAPPRRKSGPRYTSPVASKSSEVMNNSSPEVVAGKIKSPCKRMSFSFEDQDPDSLDSICALSDNEDSSCADVKTDQIKIEQSSPRHYTSPSSGRRGSLERKFKSRQRTTSPSTQPFRCSPRIRKILGLPSDKSGSDRLFPSDNSGSERLVPSFRSDQDLMKPLEIKVDQDDCAPVLDDYSFEHSQLRIKADSSCIKECDMTSSGDLKTLGNHSPNMASLSGNLKPNMAALSPKSCLRHYQTSPTKASSNHAFISSPSKKLKAQDLSKAPKLSPSLPLRQSPRLHKRHGSDATPVLEPVGGPKSVAAVNLSACLEREATHHDSQISPLIDVCGDGFSDVLDHPSVLMSSDTNDTGIFDIMSKPFMESTRKSAQKNELLPQKRKSNEHSRGRKDIERNNNNLMYRSVSDGHLTSHKTVVNRRRKRKLSYCIASSGEMSPTPSPEKKIPKLKIRISTREIEPEASDSEELNEAQLERLTNLYHGGRNGLTKSTIKTDQFYSKKDKPEVTFNIPKVLKLKLGDTSMDIAIPEQTDKHLHV